MAEANSACVAARYRYPQYSQCGMHVLLRAMTVLADWRKRHPFLNWLHVPPPMAVVIALQLAWQGRKVISLALLTMLSSYGRPAKIPALLEQDIVPPGSYSIDLNPETFRAPFRNYGLTARQSYSSERTSNSLEKHWLRRGAGYESAKLFLVTYQETARAFVQT